jgi:hypothetical protein
MTSRERLAAATRGGIVDRAPWFAWAPATSAHSALVFARSCGPDAVVVESAIDAQQFMADYADAAVLVEVQNPYAEARGAGIDLQKEFDADPDNGESLLRAYSAGVESGLAAALESGSDGVLYRLQGAAPGASSPMQYGGRLLERDRELLQLLRDTRLSVLWIEEEGAYIDFLADLPAHALGWDDEMITCTEVRKVRPGALACSIQDPAAAWEALMGVGVVIAGKMNLEDPRLASMSQTCENLTTYYVS